MSNWEQATTNDLRLAKQVKKDKSIVMTKPEMADYLLTFVDFEEGDKVIEPCKGDGAFYNSLSKYNVERLYCEIDEGIDYLDFSGNVDITLSNPPFVPRALFWKFMVKSMETTNKYIYWLINMSSLNVFTPKRLNEMKEKGWFINNMVIVADRRWFGRYVWVKISKTNNNFINYCSTTF